MNHRDEEIVFGEGLATPSRILRDKAPLAEFRLGKNLSTHEQICRALALLEIGHKKCLVGLQETRGAVVKMLVARTRLVSLRGSQEFGRQRPLRRFRSKVQRIDRSMRRSRRAPMGYLLLILLLAGSAMGQQLLAGKQVRYPMREAESILIESCRVVGERFAIPLPDPRVELRLGESVNTVESDDDRHVIRLQRWNKTLFKRAAVHICMRYAERDLVFELAKKVSDH
jgi:hypothetical protein